MGKGIRKLTSMSLKLLEEIINQLFLLENKRLSSFFYLFFFTRASTTEHGKNPKSFSFHQTVTDYCFKKNNEREGNLALEYSNYKGSSSRKVNKNSKN